ncbi:MAG: hypothetical protein ACKVQQ_06495 [Burkholderiales bacterium]
MPAMCRGFTLLAAMLLLGGNSPAARAEALQEFVESGGCKLRGSATSVARQKEIAAQGAVTWTGKCVNGLIDGPGTLKHQGVTQEAGRTRRYAFHLTGVARAGLRVGNWRRESFNMFEGSARYWTSLATLNYVDGVAKGEARQREVRSNDDFSPSFRELLATLDRELATSRGGTTVTQAEPSAPAAGKPAAPAPTVPAPQAPPPASAPAVAVQPSAPANVAAPAAPTPTPSAVALPVPPAASVQPPPAATIPTAPPAASAVNQTTEPPRTGVFPIIPPIAVLTAPGGVAVSPSAPVVPEARGTLRLLAPAGTQLPAPTPPATPNQLLLEQRGACAIDQINQQAVGEESVTIQASQPLTVTGWAADPNQPRPGVAPNIPERAWVRFWDRAGGPGLLVEVQRNLERRDVARALGHPGYAKAGFRVSVPPGRLRASDYTVSVLQVIGADLAVCSSIGRLQLR